MTYYVEIYSNDLFINIILQFNKNFKKLKVSYKKLIYEIAMSEQYMHVCTHTCSCMHACTHTNILVFHVDPVFPPHQK